MTYSNKFLINIENIYFKWNQSGFVVKFQRICFKLKYCSNNMLITNYDFFPHLLNKENKMLRYNMF